MTRPRPSGFGGRARARPVDLDIRIRQRPAGFDARPERPSSLRAQAQRVFRAAAERADTLKDTPLPNPPPQGGREPAVRAEGKENQQARVESENLTPLTRQVRALYEDSVVPVAEIARLAGVHERTLYKYAEKGQWRRRYGGNGVAAGVAKRAAVRKPRACVTAKGAGGRFIRNADAGKSFVRGLKALDPLGEQRALESCERAAALSDDAAARTLRLREAMSDARTLALMVQVLRDLTALEDRDKPAAMSEPEEEKLATMRAELARKIENAVAGWSDEEKRARQPRGQGG